MHESVKPDDPAEIVASLRTQYAIKLTNLNAVRAYLDADSVLHHQAADLIAQLLADRARPPQDAKPEPVGGRDVLFFTSYCGGDNPGCTDARPCADCLAMSNVYSIPAETEGTYRRELGAVSHAPPPLAVEALREALEPFAKIAKVLGGKPPAGNDDILHAWRTTNGDAILRMSDCVRALKSLGDSDGR